MPSPISEPFAKIRSYFSPWMGFVVNEMRAVVSG
jgi:hypothetical protein